MAPGTSNGNEDSPDICSELDFLKQVPTKAWNNWGEDRRRVYVYICVCVRVHVGGCLCECVRMSVCVCIYVPRGREGRG